MLIRTPLSLYFPKPTFRRPAKVALVVLYTTKYSHITMAMQPMAMYGIEVPCGDVAISARPDIPSAFRITMAAIDPSAEPEGEEDAPPRATLKVIRQSLFDDEDDLDDDSDDGFDTEEMERILAGEASDESSEDDDAEVNGGPSDPAKSKQAKRAAAEKKIRKLLAQDGMDLDDEEEEESDDEPNGINGINGVSKSAKGKGKMPASDSDEDEDDLDMDDEEEFEEFVVCTLDPSKVRTISTTRMQQLLTPCTALSTAARHYLWRE